MVDNQANLSVLTRNAITDDTNSPHVPVIVLTELHRLVRKGRIRIEAPDGLDNWFRKDLEQHQAECEPITVEIAHAAEVLPPIHNDPADRFILATAVVLEARILSPDTVMPKYPGVTVAW